MPLRVPGDLPDERHPIREFHQRMHVHLRHGHRQDAVPFSGQILDDGAPDDRAQLNRKMHLGSRPGLLIPQQPGVLTFWGGSL